ncbi:MAG TPA: hypothetical protein VFV38_42175 [Ktedonobacteraceae bacterium]|nr:hypothetical protein [Ktedonobacteraceae bacterium]
MKEEFQLDTISVSELGTSIVNGAQSEKSSPDPLALDNFQRDLHSVVPEMPQILQHALTQFTTNFAKGYGDVLDQRIAIGHILLSTATAAEKNEVQTANWFLDTSPQILVN